MPRKSAAELSVVPLPGVLARRPEPPSEFSAAAAESWRRIVSCWPATHFDASAQALLAQFCQASATVEFLTRRIADLTARELTAEEEIRLSRLLRSRAAETAQCVSLSRQLRLGPQQRHRRETVATEHARGGGGYTKKPWDR